MCEAEDSFILLVRRWIQLVWLSRYVVVDVDVVGAWRSRLIYGIS